MEIKKNDVFTAVINGYTSEGNGVCRIEGRAVFVPGALRGETWEVRLVKVTSSAVWGRGERLISASEMRREPDCPAYPACGGCAMRHMRYEEELRCKLQRVNDSLRRIGGLSLAAEEILPADEKAKQRQKAIFNIGEQNGNPVGGFYRARSHDIVPTVSCPAVPDTVNRCLRAVLQWMRQNHIPAYDEASGQDGIRHVFVRVSARSGNAVLTVASSLPSGAVNTATLIREVRASVPEVSGIVWNWNTARGNTVLTGAFDTLWGEATLQEELCGLTFSLSPRSFFQVNPAQAEKLYRRALDYAGISSDTVALDLYCGTGTIALCMAKFGARVFGVEIIREAVENAVENARRNHLEERCEFLCADAAEAAEALAARHLAPGVVVVDPPRKGLEEAVIQTVAAMNPERVIYISCEPATLARDLKIFGALGYTAEKATAVDMFPATPHVETVVLMSRVDK